MSILAVDKKAWRFVPAPERGSKWVVKVDTCLARTFAKFSFDELNTLYSNHTGHRYEGVDYCVLVQVCRNLGAVVAHSMTTSPTALPVPFMPRALPGPPPRAEDFDNDPCDILDDYHLFHDCF